MPKYRVLRGTYRTEDGTRAEPGDTVELSKERRARLPRGKMERVHPDDEDQQDSESTPETTDEPDADPESDEAEPDGTMESDDGDDAAGESEESTTNDKVPGEADAKEESIDTSSLVPEDQQQLDPDEVEASGDVPDDYQLLSKMAKHYDGDEVHGSMGGDELKEFFIQLSDTEIANLKRQAEEELS